MFSFTFNQVSVFFYGFKSQLSNSYDNWYVQKYLKGIFHKGMLLIWKKYFTCAILSFSSPRCLIIAHLSMIYTKFRHAMIAQLNKIWCVWVCACAIACHSQPGLIWVVKWILGSKLLLKNIFQHYVILWIINENVLLNLGIRVLKCFCQFKFYCRMTPRYLIVRAV